MTMTMTTGLPWRLLRALVPALALACATDSDPTELGEAGTTEAGTTDADTDDSSGTAEEAPDGRWSCLGQVESPAWVPGAASVQFTIVEFPAAILLSGATLEVCDLADLDCTAPMDSAMTSATGTLEVAVSTEMSTYFQVTGEGVADSLFFRRGVPPPSDPYVTELGALSPATLSAFIGLTGADNDAERGHLIVTARDCAEALAAG
ncbi:MAG: hypothetical protein JKY37_14265, partial [Nannocystaceae bacterium]|nr:hypothetical protein [Nannocystaceae bacterium]